MSDHGEGCRCTGNAWEDRRECPWFAAEFDMTSIPLTLGQCRVCHALLAPSEDYDHAHMRWHESQGHLRAAEPENGEVR